MFLKLKQVAPLGFKSGSIWVSPQSSLYYRSDPKQRTVTILSTNA